MNQNKQKSVAIAGGGISGIAMALFLDELGFKVHLFEKKPIFGGRTYSFKDKKTGFEIDNGQHLLIGAYHETLNLIRKVGTFHKLFFLEPNTVPLLDELAQIHHFQIKNLPLSLGMLFAVFKYKKFNFQDKIFFLKLGLKLKKYLKSPQLIPTDQTILEWLNSIGTPSQEIKTFLNILALATLNDNIETTTAKNIIEVFIRSFFSKYRDSQLIFPKSGLSKILIEPAISYLTTRGHYIHKKLGLKEIKIINNKVCGFLLSNNEIFKADYYISALPCFQLKNILPRSILENNSQLKLLNEILPSTIISINLFLKKEIFKESFVGSLKTKAHWFFNRNHYIKENSNHLHHIVGVISGANKMKSLSKDELLDLVIKDLKTIDKNFNKNNIQHVLINKETEATLSCTPHIDNLRPTQKIYDNFYIIGDWTKTDLPPTIESAIVSAKIAAESIEKNNM